MSNPPWAELITMETLPNDDLKFLASITGLPPIIYLMCYYQGSTYTAPKNATLKATRKYVKRIMMVLKLIMFSFAKFVIYQGYIFLKLLI